MNRRRFLQNTAVLSATAATGPLLLGTQNKADNRPMVTGQGEHRYEVLHDWLKLPDQFTWQTTHNVAVDSQANVYVIHEGRKELKDHPSIFVFDNTGKYIRSFGKQFQGGGHGIEIRKEGNDEFLYVCAYQHLKTFAKMTPTGETVWQKYAPMDSGVYAPGEDTKPTGAWGQNRFMPTNFAWLPGSTDFFLVDGYGGFVVHRYDKDGNWKSHFGGPGTGKGKFNTPHGLWVDTRGEEPRIVVCDRANHTLQFFDINGKYQKTLTGFGLPANAEIHKGLLVIPELHARVTLLDKDDKVVAQLGDDVARVTGKNGGGIRGDAKHWQNAKFVHPHDACFDADGNILVAEWVATGRMTKLRKVS
ncbi:MAG: twin-arginine translocation signal domain-containing protein [Planctomycetota bacterium]|nr:twin-arginine translocation signal domain-containing protein [Planctomycetota bacterium]